MSVSDGSLPQSVEVGSARDHRRPHSVQDAASRTTETVDKGTLLPRAEIVKTGRFRLRVSLRFHRGFSRELRWVSAFAYRSQKAPRLRRQIYLARLQESRFARTPDSSASHKSRS